ncbi:MAG: protein kinase domain-containing protein, partial [Kofleriaceae bacterium]
EVLSVEDDVLRRFARETRITARLEHPSIVPVHDAGALPGGAPFYVMRKISGRPLEQLVAAAETLAQRLVLIPHVLATAQAVAHAHERGIVHRDIKPSNILVGELGETIVIDWGLAKVIDEVDEPLAISTTVDDHDLIRTRAGIVFGTPGFMAPEQLRGAPVTERCDVYAIGATLYHLLARKPPHYARTADEMMRAAVRSAPPSIRALVEGVPAELSTIIDKALAHDPDARYRSARELAEDLQRFLSGQLVASHHYSVRERLARFVRRNRVPVTVGAVAAAALVAVGLIAVVRVVGERDRADEAARIAVAEKQVAERERQLAEQRADQLTLTQARIEAEANPTQAIARLKPLAAKHAREVASIAAAARATGVAWSLPASRHTTTLELSRDGQRALAAGDDGALRLYDLARRSHRELLSLGGPTSARFADEERRIVAWTGDQISVIDVATLARRTIAAPRPIRDLAIVGITAYWVDDRREVWQLDLAGTVPLQLQLDERIDRLAPSPDGRWIAMYGEYHLLLLDRTQPAAPPVEVTIGRTKDLDWSEDSERFAALVDASAIEAAVVPEPQILQRLHVGNRRWVALGNRRVYTIGPTGVSVASRNDAESGPRKQLVGEPSGLRASRGGSMIAGTQREIAVISDQGDHQLVAPAGPIELVEAHPRSPYVLATIEGRLLVWNLDEIEPRRIVDRPPAVARFVGPDHAIVGFADQPARWIDLAAGTTEPLGALAVHSVLGAPGGGAACVIDLGHRGWLVSPDRPPQPIEGAIDHAGFIADDRLLLGTAETGAIQLLETRTGARSTLIDAPGKLVSLAWSAGTAAAAFDDGLLWRRDLATGVAATAHSSAAPTTTLQVTTDGTVWFGQGRVVRAWRPGGSLDNHAELPRPIALLGRAGTGHLLAVLDDGTGHLVELATPGRVHETEGLEEHRAALASGAALDVSISAEAGLVVAPGRGGVEVIDPLVRHRWVLAGAPPAPTPLEKRVLTYADPQLSPDGRRVIARLPTGLFGWTIQRPAEAETAAWLDQLTDAVIDPTSGKLGWR